MLAMANRRAVSRFLRWDDVKSCLCGGRDCVPWENSFHDMVIVMGVMVVMVYPSRQIGK
jgi:hypothetical protein